MLDSNKTPIAFYELSDMLSTAIVVLDQSLNVLQINVAAEDLFGKSRERIVNQSFNQLLDQELNKEELLFAVNFVSQNNEAHVIRGCHLKNTQARIAIVDCIANPVLSDNNYVGIVLELPRIDQQLKAAREQQLLSQQEMTQKLLRGMAHEIKNPLGGLRGAAQLLDSELADEELKEYTAIIIAEADRLKNLVDRMLGARKANQNQRINIHQILERVHRIVKTDIPPGVTVNFDYDPSIPDFIADLDNLIQIILNIVINALNALGDNGKLLFKTRVIRNHIINHKQYKLSLRLDICDDGEGVPAEIRDKLFFPMISGSASGTGLGLSIAQTLAQRQNGVIEFESEPGNTCFSLLLPIDTDYRELT